MTSSKAGFTVGYVAKMFPRLSETFVLNEILELERQGVNVVIFSAKKPNEGKFHPQLARLKAEIVYLEDLDPRKWASWIGQRWTGLSPHRTRLWELIEEFVAAGDREAVETAWLGAWVGARCEELGVDRLHAHFATLPSTIAYMANRVTGIPFSFTAHAKDIFVYEPSETLLAEKIEASDFMVTVTAYNKRHLTNILPDADADKIRVLHNGIDLTTFTPREDSGRDPSLILGVGRLVVKKGFSTLIRACAGLSAQGVKYRCVIAGGGPEQAALATLIKELGVESTVTLVGSVTHDQVLELMGQCAVFCLPCTKASDNNLDALPTVLLESLATCTPSVSTTVSGIPEIIESGVDGVLVEPDDAQILASTLADMLLAPDRRRSLAAMGRTKAETRFDITKNVRRLHEMFKSGGREPLTHVESAIVDSAPRRALYVCADKGIPFGGNKGASIHVREFTEALQLAGYEPTVVAARRARKSSYLPTYPAFALNDTQAELLPHDADSSDHTLHSAVEFSRQQAFFELLVKASQRGDIEVVCERYSLYGLGGLAVARRLGVPFVLEVNSPLVEEAVEHRGLEDPSLARAVEARLFCEADHIFVVSQRLREHVLTIAPEARVTVLPNGVNTDRFRAESGVARDPVLQAENDQLTIGFVGRVRPWHGVEDLIEAFSHVVRERPDVRLCVVGNTDGMTGSLVENLRRHNIEDRVTLTGEVAAGDMPGVIAGLDILVAPYPAIDNFYFSPLKVFEYMAAGKAIVAANIGQIPDVLEHGQTALLYEAGNTAALTDSLLEITNDGKLRERLGMSARAEAVARHTWRHRVDVFTSVVEQLTADTFVTEKTTKA